MTSWSAAGSPTRYYQCPFCKRTLCSAYDEAFERGTLARRLAPAPRPTRASPAAPEASAEDVRWKELKGRAARWFARIEADGRSHAPAVVELATAGARARA